MLEALTGFLRATLPLFNRPALALGEELQAVRSYLQVMQARLGDRLRLTVQVPDSLHALVPLPPGLMLTLVENAVEHGVHASLVGAEVLVVGHAKADGCVLQVLRHRPRPGGRPPGRRGPGQQPRPPGPGLGQRGHPAAQQPERRRLRRHPDPAPARNANSEPMTRQQPTALVADDEEAPRQQLIKALQQAWPELHIVAEAHNGVDAWDAWLEHEPDLCFLDIRMPGLSGIDVARRIGGRTPVVFVTAYGDHALAAFDAGAVDYVMKPVEAERLAQAVARVQAACAQHHAPLHPAARRPKPDPGLQALLDQLAGQAEAPRRRR
jgi:CheY-like chemotaxis protein